jgi:WD40 repeat protein
VVADKVLNGLQLSNTVLSFANWGIGINDRDGNLRVLTVPDLEPAFGQIGVPPMHTPWLDPREHVVAYVDSDAVLHVFDLATDSEIPPTGIVMFDTDEPWPQPQILLSPDRAQVIVAYGGGLLMVNAQQGAQPTPMLDHPGYRVWVNHDPKMTILTAIANGDPTLHMWDTTTRKRLSGFPGHTGSVASHAFTSNGSEVLTVDSEGTLRIWASPSHSWRAAFGQSSALSHQIAFDHTNRLIFIPNHEGDLVSFPIGASNADQTHTAIHQSDDVSRVTLSADRSLIATAGLENTVRVLNRATGQSHDIELPDDVVSVTGLRFSPDESSSLLATSINPARLLIFDPVKESVTHEWEINTKALISGLAWSHDGSMLACSLRNGKIALIRDIDRADVQIIDLDATHLRSLSFVEGQSNLVAVGESGVLYVVDTLTGAIKESERLSEHSLFCVATHPKGQIGVVGDRAGNVKVVDLITLTELATFDAGGSVMWMEFVDEGNALMISALDCPVEIWNLTDLASTLRLIEP